MSDLGQPEAQNHDGEAAFGSPSRFLGLDVGSVRVGVALSDPTNTFAQPLTTLLRYKAPIEAIVQQIADYAVGTIVVGQPLTLAGARGPAVMAIEAFTQTLGERVQVPIILWDERLTTRMAERDLIAMGTRRNKRRAQIDRVAASLILQSYLDSRAALF